MTDHRHDWDYKLSPREEIELVNDIERYIETRKRGHDNGWRPEPAEWMHIMRMVWTR